MAAKTTTSDTGADKMADARKRNLDAAISHIQKEFGEAAIMRMGDDTRMDVEVIPTGNLLIDRALGVGGFLAAGSSKFSDQNPPVKPH